MPIYVYECERCGKRKEVISRFDQLFECPCGGTMRRAITGHAKTPTKWAV